MSNIENHMLVVRSITYAMKGQQMLLRYGITSYVERLANPNREQGCGYGLRVRGDVNLALNILSSVGIPAAEIQEV